MTWLQHDHGGYFDCPDGAVADWEAIGWVRCDTPPEPVSPVVAENLAAQQEAAQVAATPAESTTKPQRGASTKEG